MNGGQPDSLIVPRKLGNDSTLQKQILYKAPLNNRKLGWRSHYLFNNQINWKLIGGKIMIEYRYTKDFDEKQLN
ncbi:hypothetical protein [Lacrimispora sp.]|uniref:hypothetical protein n=1 Tax=Lacrimispora sp. TaxID=2719234 RepID=UPI0028AD80BA|nr:hypothetical protein [Lacrimispora sp.]